MKDEIQYLMYIRSLFIKEIDDIDKRVKELKQFESSIINNEQLIKKDYYENTIRIIQRRNKDFN